MVYNLTLVPEAIKENCVGCGLERWLFSVNLLIIWVANLSSHTNVWPCETWNQLLTWQSVEDGRLFTLIRQTLTASVAPPRVYWTEAEDDEKLLWAPITNANREHIELHKRRSGKLLSPRDLGHDLLPSLHAPWPPSSFKTIQPSTSSLPSIPHLLCSITLPLSVCLLLSLSISLCLCLWPPLPVYVCLCLLVCPCVYIKRFTIAPFMYLTKELHTLEYLRPVIIIQ